MMRLNGGTMVSERLRKTAGTLESQGTMNFLDPATPEQISEFERKNGITFPEQYREWLSFSDGGELFLPAGCQLYGVAHLPLIDPSDGNRPDDSWVAVGAMCSGDAVIFEKESGRFAVYFAEEGRLDDSLVYKDYFTFLGSLYDLLGMDEEDDDSEDDAEEDDECGAEGPDDEESGSGAASGLSGEASDPWYIIEHAEKWARDAWRKHPELRDFYRTNALARIDAELRSYDRADKIIRELYSSGWYDAYFYNKATGRDREKAIHANSREELKKIRLAEARSFEPDPDDHRKVMRDYFEDRGSDWMCRGLPTCWQEYEEVCRNPHYDGSLSWDDGEDEE